MSKITISVTDYNNMLEVLKKAYRKHCMHDDRIGWLELDNNLLDVLCNVLGNDGFDEWRKTLNSLEVD